MISFRKNAAAIALIAIIGASVAVPFATLAQTYTTASSIPYWGPLISCTGQYPVGSAAQSGGPYCTSLCDLINTVINILYFLITVAVFAISPIMFAVGGIMVMFSGANPGMLESGKKILWGTLIGLVIVLCAYLIVYTVLQVFGVTAIGGFGGAGCTPD